MLHTTRFQTRLSVATPITHLALFSVLNLGLPLVTSAATVNPTLMHGQLDVQEQRGAVCSSPVELPVQLPVWAIWQEGQWWLWGDMAPMRLRSSPQDVTGRADLLPWTHDIPLGEAQWIKGMGSEHNPGRPATLVAQWRENESPNSCAFTTATLRLVPWAAPTDSLHPPSTSAADVLAHQHLLKEALSSNRALQSSYNATEAAPRLQRMVELARHAKALDPARQDRSLALAWLEAGERASLLRQHTQALELLQAAVAHYIPLAGQNHDALQDAALSLSSLARAQLRARYPEQAQTTLTQAIALLDRYQGAQTAAAASLHNQQGALWLRNQRPRQALESFSLALKADEFRSAPAIEHVSTLMNSAVALTELGQPDAARALYQRGQRILNDAPVTPDSERLAEWIQARLQALSEPSAGKTIAL